MLPLLILENFAVVASLFSVGTQAVKGAVNSARRAACAADLPLW
jgi:hypothetical protein